MFIRLYFKVSKMEKDSQSTTQKCEHTFNRIKRGTLKQAKKKHSERPNTTATKDDEAYIPSSNVLIGLDKGGRLKNTRVLSTSFQNESKSKNCSGSKYGKKRKQMDKRMCGRSYDDYQIRKNDSHHETDGSLRTESSVRMILNQSEFNRLNYLYEKAIHHGQHAGKHVGLKHVDSYRSSCHRQDNLYQMSPTNGKIPNEETENSDTNEYSSLEDSTGTSSSGTEYGLSINHSNGSPANSRRPAENHLEKKRYLYYLGINEHKPLIVEYEKQLPQRHIQHGKWENPGASIENYRYSTATEESTTEWSSSDDDGDFSNESSMQHEQNKLVTSSTNRSIYSTDTSSLQNSKMKCSFSSQSEGPVNPITRLVASPWSMKQPSGRYHSTRGCYN